MTRLEHGEGSFALITRAGTNRRSFLYLTYLAYVGVIYIKHYDLPNTLPRQTDQLPRQREVCGFTVRGKYLPARLGNRITMFIICSRHTPSISQAVEIVKRVSERGGRGDSPSRGFRSHCLCPQVVVLRTEAATDRLEAALGTCFPQ